MMGLQQIIGGGASSAGLAGIAIGAGKRRKAFRKAAGRAAQTAGSLLGRNFDRFTQDLSFLPTTADLGTFGQARISGGAGENIDFGGLFDFADLGDFPAAGEGREREIAGLFQDLRLPEQERQQNRLLSRLRAQGATSLGIENATRGFGEAAQQAGLRERLQAIQTGFSQELARRQQTFQQDLGRRQFTAGAALPGLFNRAGAIDQIRTQLFNTLQGGNLQVQRPGDMATTLGAALFQQGTSILGGSPNFNPGGAQDQEDDFGGGFGGGGSTPFASSFASGGFGGGGTFT